MKTEITLDELKRQNAEEEVSETETVDSEEEGLAEDEANEEHEEGDSEADEEEEDAEEKLEQTLEPWMLEEQDSDEDGQVPLKKHISVRSKLKGKLKDKDDEIEQLKQRIAEMESKGSIVAQAPEVAKKPNRSDFYDREDPEEAYLEAMFEWRDKQAEAKYQSRSEQQRTETEARRFKEKIDESVDRHYERAEKLIEKHGISPDAYRAADENFRKAIKAVRPTDADDVADRVISILGEGSERVLFYAGKNESTRAMIQSKLAEDQSGLSLVAYLAELKALKASNGKPKQSRAAKPAPTVKGDKPQSASEGKLKKAYLSEKDAQKRWDIRREAKQRGFKVNDW